MAVPSVPFGFKQLPARAVLSRWYHGFNTCPLPQVGMSQESIRAGKGHCAWEKVSKPNSQNHRQENPQSQSNRVRERESKSRTL